MSGTPTRLRALFGGDAPVVAPGAFNALFARLIEEAGFGAVYVSGAGVANALLGRPDLGLVTMSEMATVAAQICEVVEVPVIADGDTGYGGVHNVARTVAAVDFPDPASFLALAALQLIQRVAGPEDERLVEPLGEVDNLLFSLNPCQRPRNVR